MDRHAEIGNEIIIIDRMREKGGGGGGGGGGEAEGILSVFVCVYKGGGGISGEKV